MKTTNARKVAQLNASQIALYASRINSVLHELDEQNATIAYGALAKRIELGDWSNVVRVQLNALLDVAAAIATASGIAGDVSHASFKRVVSATSGQAGTGINVRCRIVIEHAEAANDEAA